MKPLLSADQDAADYKLSAPCFALPQNTPIETVSVWGSLFCVLVSPFALVSLLFKPPRRIKHTLGSFLLGVLIAVALGIWGVSIGLSGASLHG